MREGWTYKKLGEVGVVVTGSTPSTKDEANYASPDYCFVKPSDLPSEGIAVIDESEFHISSKAFSSARQLPKGSVVVSCIGIIGKVGILNKDACTNQQINAIIPNDTILPKCLAYIICNNKRELEQIANAPIVPIINKSEFSKFSIPVPPLSEQQSIVAELDKINELISLKKAQLSDLDSLAQSIFYDMFGDYEDDTPLSHFINSLSGGKSLAGNAPCINKVLKTGAVTYDWFDGNAVKDLPIDYVPLPEHLLKDGDLLVSRMNTPELVGSCAYVWKAPANTYLPDRLWRATLKQGNNPIYLWFSIIQLKAKEQIRTLASGTSGSMKNISKPRFLSVKIKNAPLSLQQEFAKRIELIEQQKAQISSAIKDLETLLASRMQYWFD